MTIYSIKRDELIDLRQWVVIATDEGIQYKGQLKYLPEELEFLKVAEIGALNEFDKGKYDVTPKVAGWLILYAF